MSHQPSSPPPIRFVALSLMFIGLFGQGHVLGLFLLGVTLIVMLDIIGRRNLPVFSRVILLAFLGGGLFGQEALVYAGITMMMMRDAWIIWWRTRRG